METAILTPTYGRDYTSGYDALEDFDNNKDFILANITNRYCGKPCNKTDLINHSSYTHVEIRFNRLEDFVHREI